MTRLFFPLSMQLVSQTPGPLPWALCCCRWQWRAQTLLCCVAPHFAPQVYLPPVREGHGEYCSALLAAVCVERASPFTLSELVFVCLSCPLCSLASWQSVDFSDLTPEQRALFREHDLVNPPPDPVKCVPLRFMWLAVCVWGGGGCCRCARDSLLGSENKMLGNFPIKGHRHPTRCAAAMPRG